MNPPAHSDIGDRFLTALPVFNEVESVDDVLDLVVKHSSNTLVVDDGSTDGTAEKLALRTDIACVTHPTNRGYGAALRTAFEFAAEKGFEYVVTIDCDGQHEPQRIRQFVAESIRSEADIVSGSRYLQSFDADSPPPEQRRAINMQIAQILNERLGYELTDAFCGFKSYRVKSLKKLSLTDTGYAMPLELWVQAALHRLSVIEVAVPRIYLDENRSFGEELDDPERRLNYYKQILETAFKFLPADFQKIGSARVG